MVRTAGPGQAFGASLANEASGQHRVGAKAGNCCCNPGEGSPSCILLLGGLLAVQWSHMAGREKVEVQAEE